MGDTFVKLNCANCGAKLDIYGDMDRFACAFCGTEMIVQRRGGTVALKTVMDAIQKVQLSSDRTASELALVRLDKDLANARAAYVDLEEKMSGKGSTRGCLVMILVIFGLLVLPRVSDSPVFFVASLMVLGAGAVFVFKIDSANKYVWGKKAAKVSARMYDIEAEMEKHRRVVEG